MLGLSVGMRPDDFTATGTPFEKRGRRYDAMLERLHALWDGDPAVEGAREACPPPVNGRIPIYFGTMTSKPRIAKRIARWGDGYLAVGPPEMVQPIVDAPVVRWDGRHGLTPVLGPEAGGPSRHRGCRPPLGGEAHCSSLIYMVNSLSIDLSRDRRR